MNSEMMKFSQRIREVVSTDRIFQDEPMSRHTTFQIGGPADFLVFPENAQEIARVLMLADRFGLPVTVLGNGSNVLVSDKGIRGLVLKVAAPLSGIRREGNRIIAGAGALLVDVARYAAEEQLTGLEFASGIPGSIGGAVYMNAGAYDGEIRQVVTAASAVCGQTLKHFVGEQLEFGYRHSVFQTNGCIIAEVEFTLQPGDGSEIKRVMDDLTQKRCSRQPLEMPSAGSTFKRPPGYFAGTLIEEAGLKGRRVGGAEVSTKHAGFVVNAGGASATDVLTLIKEIQHCVRERFDVELQTEVKVLGEQ
ncbi:MAG TPA: UDP-N-acetylmuramate dehydrogenase [Patescibacteria group bacterium]|nr:UDP-N-acetylmuramate dehydrogenase [Patescibacteria group bacterium]